MSGYSFRGRDFFSQPEVKFHMEPPWVGGTKVILNDLIHMTNDQEGWHVHIW